MELEQYWQFGAALVFVLALIGVLFWVIQKVGFGGGKGRRGSRLGIVEAAVVDKRRRLVLIRRDAVEHLVMIGGPQDVVVENNITRRGPGLTAEATPERRRDNGPDFNIRPGEQAPLTTGAVAADPRLADDDTPAHLVRTEAVQDAEIIQTQVQTAARAPEMEPVPTPMRPQEPHHEPAPRPEEPAPPAAAAHGETEIAQPRPQEPHPPEEQRRPQEPSPPARPWPPSEGRFREAQRRFAERSDYHPPGRASQDQSAAELNPHYPRERQAVGRAAPDGMLPPERPREVSQEGQPRTPANLNVRPGED